MFPSRDVFLKNLAEETIRSIITRSKKIIIWGAGIDALQFLAKISIFGALEFVSGLIDNCITIQGQTFFGLPVQPPSKLPELELGTLVIASDKDKESILQEFSRIDTRIPQVILGGDMNYEFDDAVFYEIVASCPVKSKAGGYPGMLIHLYQSLKYIAEKNLQGSVAEFGVFQGRTTVFMAKVLINYGKYTNRIFQSKLEI